MRILEDLNSARKSRGLSYVLVGGHAIIARGYAMTTRDLDPRSAEFHATCEKYANKDIHERIVQFWGEGSSSS